MKQQSYIGHTAISEFSNILDEIGVKHLLLVRGKQSYVTCGAAEIMEKIFADKECEITAFYDFSTNPHYEDAQKGLKLLQGKKIDAIIAIGGGSIMDIGKLLRHLHAATTGQQLPLLALPTTAGTGAETTKFAVMYKDGMKQSVEADDILPDYAFVYPQFTYSASPYLTACAGFDALAQAIEAFWNKNATNESDEYARKAIKLIFDSLPNLVNHPTNELRDKISLGAYHAGQAINITRTTAPHAFSYAFTTHCDYPHGHAVALTFPYFASLNSEFFQGKLQHGIEEHEFAKKMQELHALLNCQQGKILDLFANYCTSIGLGWKNIRPSEKELQELLDQVNIERLANNPVIINESEVRNLQNYLIES